MTTMTLTDTFCEYTKRSMYNKLLTHFTQIKQKYPATNASSLPLLSVECINIGQKKK